MVGVVHRHLATVGPRVRRLVAAVLLAVIVYGLGTWFFPKSVPRFTFLAVPTTYPHVTPAELYASGFRLAIFANQP